MYTTNLRKVGGSVMMAIPPALLELLELEAGSVVGVELNGQKLVIQTHTKPRYSLDDLLALCNPKARRSAKDREWLDSPAVGREL